MTFTVDVLSLVAGLGAGMMTFGVCGWIVQTLELRRVRRSWNQPLRYSDLFPPPAPAAPFELRRAHPRFESYGTEISVAPIVGIADPPQPGKLPSFTLLG